MLGSFNLPLCALYAETHFTFFRGQPSLLFKREPEILFDMPRRLGPGQDLPVVLVLNDIARFPATVEQIQLAVSDGTGEQRVYDFDPGAAHVVEHPFAERCRVYLLHISGEHLSAGLVHVNGKASVRRGRRLLQVMNDNFAGASHLCMSCLVSGQDLPGTDKCSYGDMHTHSQFSESHVEFGLPLEAMSLLAGAYGFRFVCVTDHSYDLSTRIDDYLTSDVSAPRWDLQGREFERQRSGALLIRGEEVSCLNSRGEVVHLCGAGLSSYIPGSLDGARRGRSREPQVSVAEALERIHEQGGIAYAAHPGAAPGLLQRMLLKRGRWHEGDIREDLDGVQASNGDFDRQWEHSSRLWRAGLASGKRVPVIGGSDAHGDFNRYRCIRSPFLSIGEYFQRYLGYIRTGVYGQVGSFGDLRAAVQKGKTFVTSGPFLDIRRDSTGESVVGETLDVGDDRTLTVTAQSTPEFGHVISARVLGLKRGSRREVVTGEWRPRDDSHEIIPKMTLPSSIDQYRYLRAECECERLHGARCFAATSPVYVGSGD